MLNCDIDKCGIYISIIYRKFWQSITKDLKELNLTENQYILLGGIYNNKGTNQSFLANILVLDPGTVSKNLKILEDCGYIFKVVDKENRRNFKLYLTEDGYKLTEKGLALREKFFENIFENLNENDMENLKILLEQAKNKLDKD